VERSGVYREILIISRSKWPVTAKILVFTEIPMSLPAPSSEASAHSRSLVTAIAGEIAARGGWIPFSRFMDMLLYQPGLGYYSAGARKFGVAGDFVTAPEMSACFGRALARQCADLLAVSAPQLLEVGAGSGRLAADLLGELERLDALPAHYDILDLSADLRERQQATLAAAVPHLLSRVRWLDRLPARFSGVVIGNELLDAMPADVVAWRENGICERGVSVDPDGGFTWNEAGKWCPACRRGGNRPAVPTASRL